jgi:hypothetical protein
VPQDRFGDVTAQINDVRSRDALFQRLGLSILEYSMDGFPLGTHRSESLQIGLGILLSAGQDGEQREGASESRGYFDGDATGTLPVRRCIHARKNLVEHVFPIPRSLLGLKARSGGLRPLFLAALGRKQAYRL